MLNKRLLKTIHRFENLFQDGVEVSVGEVTQNIGSGVQTARFLTTVSDSSLIQTDNDVYAAVGRRKQGYHTEASKYTPTPKRGKRILKRITQGLSNFIGLATLFGANSKADITIREIEWVGTISNLEPGKIFISCSGGGLKIGDKVYFVPSVGEQSNLSVYEYAGLGKIHTYVVFNNS